jgi:hypothetical protein
MNAREANPDDFVFKQVLGTLGACRTVLARRGEAACFYQATQVRDQDAEVEERRLSPDEARQYLAAKASSGFQGLLLFAALSANDLLIVEGYDTVEGVSAAVENQLKRGLTGKLKQTTAMTISRTAPELLRAIESQAGTETGS